MAIFRKYLLPCVLILLFARIVAGRFLFDEDMLTRDTDFSQADDNNDESIDYRLPTSIKPISYEIMIIPDLESTFKFEGIVQIKALVIRATDTVTLNVGNLQITSNSVVMNKTNLYQAASYDNVTEKWTTILSTTLEEGSEIVIAFEYNSILNDDMIGLYRSSYVDKDKRLKWLAATQFAPMYARHAFPCFDEPSYKTTFKIRILRGNNYTCLSNMPLAETAEVKDKTWDTFEESIPMPTYLVGFVIMEFHDLMQDSFKVWTRSSIIDQASYALRIGSTALEILGDAFQQKYPLPKMDMVAVPDLAYNAMENWGLVMYREACLFYNEDDSTALAQQNVASVIVHELAHMWFGNLVTPEWWSYVWLSEGFATYFQYFITADIEKTWNMKEQFVLMEHQSVLTTDALEFSHPLTWNVSSQSQIGAALDSITYSKGASIVHMMSLIFGTNIFKPALHDYLRENKVKGLGNPDSLWKVFQTYVDRELPSLSASVKEIMDTWTKQSGYPVVLVTVGNEGVLRVSQHRFLLRNLYNISTDVTWLVPLTWTTQSAPNFQETTIKHLLSTEEDTISFQIDPKEWVIFNVQSSGFYRVNYNREGWQRIFKVLNSSKYEEIHVLNRATIVDDLLNLGRAGYQDYDTVLNGMTYLKREINYLPFKAAFNGLSYLNKRFAGHEGHFLFKKYVMSLIDERRKVLGYEDRRSDNRLTVLLRYHVNKWACQYDDEECVTIYLDKFQKWRAEPSARIQPNERAAAYCVAIKNGTSEDWQFLWQQYQNSNNAADQKVIARALGCTLNIDILEKYLKLAISDYQSSGIRKQDSASIFIAVYSSGLTGAEYIIDFVDKHYNDMVKYYGEPKQIAKILDGASRHFSTRELVNKFQSLIDRHRVEFSPILKSLEHSLKVAEYELEWYKNASVSIIRWLQAYDSESTATEPIVTALPPDMDITKYRLPENIYPESYSISVTPHLYPTFTFDGTVIINAQVLKPTKQIVLHSARINHRNVNVNVSDTNIKIANNRSDEKYSFYIIELVEELSVGTKLKITIEYSGLLSTSEHRGFYRSSYLDENGTTRWLATTHLEPVGARQMFPCFDEPAMKAQFNVQVCAPSGYHVLSNMGNPHESKGEDCKWFNFPTSEKMSTYLVAVVVSDFASKKAKSKYAVYARPNAIDQAEFSLSVMSPLIDFFETKFDLKYTISKLEMVALPDFPPSAMENWGLLTFKETSMLYDIDNSPLTSRQAIRNVIAHEIAHQWFGNLVTPLWWKYLWLSEGFARYFQYHAVALVFNDTTLGSQFVVDHLHSALFEDSSNSTHPMSHDVYSPEEISSIFDRISYAKAASVLRMMEKSYGSEMFYGALKEYLKKSNYSTVTPENLYEAFQAQIDVKKMKDNIEEMLNTWTTQPGYPVLHVDIQEEIVTFKQERFFLKKNADNSTDAIWHIPITITPSTFGDYSNTTPVFWMKEEEEKINLKDYNIKPSKSEVLTVNVQQSGFYRVNYNKDYWLQLIKALKGTNYDNIHKINRAALIDDLMNFARADYIDYQLAISATEYLRNERSYFPWRAFYNNLPYLEKRFRGRDMEDLFKKYLISLIKPLYTKLQFQDSMPNEDGSMNLNNLLRMYTREWACKLHISHCRFFAARFFQRKYLSDLIPPNFRGVVYCTAMRTDKTNNSYNFLWEEYLNSNVTTDKLVVLNSLTCSENKDVLEKLLLDAIAESSYIRFQDSAKVFSDVYDASLIGVEVVINVIQNHYDDLLRHFNSHAGINKIVNGLATALSTHDLYQKYKDLLTWLYDTERISKKEADFYLSKAQYEFDWYDMQAPEIFEGIDQLLLDDTHRLPNTLYPELYNIYLTPDMEKATFEGRVQINLRVDRDTTSIILNAHNIIVTDIKVYRNDEADVTEIPVSNYMIDSHTQQLKIYLKDYVNAKKILTEIKYNGTLNDAMHGFYRSSYMDDKGKHHWLATTQFEGTYAREAFPCFDEPAFKSFYVINIQRPKHYNALSNMPLEKSTPVKDTNYVHDKFRVTTEPMSTYLVAFVVSEFIPLNSSKEFINVWGRPEVTQYGYYAKNLTVSFLHELENFTDISYSLPKLDLIGIPDFNSGAMENWGLITFREYGLFYDKYGTTSALEKYLITVVAHELAHTWFGNFVTCQWWEYIWLHEGFAEYLQWFIADAVLPEYKFMDQFVVYELQAALAQDSSNTTHPMTKPVKTSQEIEAIFDYVTYEKSASVLRMLFNAFNNEVHQKALQDYLKKYKGSTARPADLWKSFEGYASISVDGRKLSVEEVMETWTNQPGYPVVHAQLNDSVLTLTQERFLISTGNMSNMTTGNKATEFYWIPIRIETSITELINLNNNLWLGPEPANIFINPINEWFLVNFMQTGFYRVNYDTYSWKRLIAQLNNKRFINIHMLNRAQIIDDLYNLARAGYVNYTLWLDASRYLVQEENHLPWKAFFNGFSYVHKRFEGQDDQENLNKYIVYLTSKIYNKLKFDDLDSDQHLDGLQREIILQWACKVNNTDCTKTSQDLFAAWRNDTEKQISRNARTAVYCTAIREGSIDDWNFLWRWYLQTNFASEQKIIIDALGCSTNKEVLYDYLMKVISANVNNVTIRKQDASAVFSAVYSGSQLGVNVTLDFLIENFKDVYHYFGSSKIRTLCSKVASYISDVQIYDKLQILYAIDTNIFSQDFTNHVNAIVNNNLDWYDVYGQLINKWITEELKKSPNSSCIIIPLNIVLMSLLALIPYFLSN